MAYKRNANGLASLRNLTYRLRKFRAILDEELFDAVHIYNDEITNLVREQLWNGIDGFGQYIEPPYAPRTIKNKQKKGQPTDRVTLKDTGTFYRSFEVNTENRDGFSVVSTDPKINKLREKYGYSILRLTRDSFNYAIRQYIRPYLQQRLKEKIFEK